MGRDSWTFSTPDAEGLDVVVPVSCPFPRRSSVIAFTAIMCLFHTTVRAFPAQIYLFMLRCLECGIAGRCRDVRHEDLLSMQVVLYGWRKKVHLCSWGCSSPPAPFGVCGEPSLAVSFVGIILYQLTVTKIFVSHENACGTEPAPACWPLRGSAGGGRRRRAVGPSALPDVSGLRFHVPACGIAQKQEQSLGLVSLLV